YFEAHEVWEDEWRDSEGTNKDFLHGLIQTAAAYVHHGRGNPEAILSLSESALRYLEGVPEDYRGVDVEGVRRINREVIERAERVVEDDDDGNIRVLVLREPRIEECGHGYE
ncbi:MAG: DUF309 domain-containing protein, partial [Halobacteria archaeon]|nr:DUF309 domain-containing protein [Halobacteria archaeon]